MLNPTLVLLTVLDASAAKPELKMVMADPRLPNRPTTHILDDRVSTGRIENFRELYVNPAQVGESLDPVGRLGPVARMNNPRGKSSSIPIVNETSSYAEVSVNGVKVGVIDALTNGAIHDVEPGLYEVTFGLQNGYEETRTVATLHLDEALIPGGKGVQEALESGYVPTWAAAPERGYVIIEPPKPKPKLVPRVRLLGNRIEISEKVMFALGSADIDPSSFPLLDDIFKVLTDNETVEQVEIQGHTDAQGSADANRALSQARAEAVVAYLVGKGIDAARLTPKGFGPDKPLVEGDTPEAYAANRRVELHVTKQAPPKMETIMVEEGAEPVDASPQGPTDASPKGPTDASPGTDAAPKP